MSGGIVIGSLRAILGLDLGEFTAGFNRASGIMERAGKRMQAQGRAMSRALSLPIAAFGALTLKTAGDFEQAMNKVGAVSGATGSQLDRLKDVAQEMGRTTQFSASQAAEALSFLAMAGFDVDKSIASLPGTLQLAASANIDLGRSADIVSNVMSGYRFEAADLGRVNDVLVNTFTKTNTNLEQLGEALKYAGPVASAAGVKFEESAAAIGLMGNAGIQASMAGTSLRGAIARMLSPTSAMEKVMKRLGLNFTDAEGRLLPLDQIIRQLEPHADDAGAMLELFGLRAGPAMAALVSQGADALTDLTEAVAKTGTAQRIAEAQMQGFNGEMRKLRSAFEGLLIAIGESGVLSAMTTFVNKLTEIVQSIAETNPELLRIGAIVAGLAAVIGPVVLSLGLIAAAIGAISAPVLIAVAAFGALAAAVVYLTGKTDSYETSAYDAEAGTVALNAALAVFYQTAAPAAAANAINLAQKNAELAKSARDAAAAEREKAEAISNARLAPGVAEEAGMSTNAFLGETERERDATEGLAQAEAALTQAQLDRDRAARAVTGSMHGYVAVVKAAATATEELKDETDDVSVETDDVGGGARAAAEGVDGLTSSLGGLRDAMPSVLESMAQLSERLDQIQSPGSMIQRAGNAMQQTLADALFNPFEAGLKGMIHQFSTAVLRMASDALAANLTQKLMGGLGGGIGALLGIGGGAAAFGGFGTTIPFFAEGTDFAPGGLAVVGEDGPEVVNVPRGSQVVPNDEIGAGGMTAVILADRNDVPSAMRTAAGKAALVDIGRELGWSTNA